MPHCEVEFATITLMDPDLRRSMFRYYDQRAPDYEEAYLLGTGTSSITDPTLFQSDARILAEIVRRSVTGRVVDVACGTGFWLPHYAPRATSIALMDQSPQMLEECRKKTRALGVANRTALVRGDVLRFPFEEAAFDFALVGFLLSHLSEDEERMLFASLRQALSPSGRVLILDSAWSPERSRFNAKEERQKRGLKDGSTFDIYKRYFDRDDILRWESSHGLRGSIEHFGAALIAVSGAFS